MTHLNEAFVTIDGRRARLLRGGKPGAPTAVFLHGGIPGKTVYCSGAHLWGDGLLPFFKHRDVIVLDLPGSGGTLPGPQPITIETMGRHVLEALSALSVKTFDLVGHDTGGVIGEWLVVQAPERLRSLSIVASPTAAPSSDMLDDILLVSAPTPLWTRESQAWAFDRLSYSHNHIVPELLDACVAASEGEAHRAAVASMRDSGGRAFAASVSKARYGLWEACRGAGVQVPTQIVRGSHDPTTSREAEYVLFKWIAERQPAAQFHVINRTGHFYSREQPEVFAHIVSGFQAGVLEESAR